MAKDRELVTSGPCPAIRSVTRTRGVHLPSKQKLAEFDSPALLQTYARILVRMRGKKVEINGPQAGLAQTVEQALCKHQVVGSIPTAGTTGR